MCLTAEKSESSKNNNLIKIMSESVHKLSHYYHHNHKNGSKIKNSGPIKISNYVKLTNNNTDVMDQ